MEHLRMMDNIHAILVIVAVLPVVKIQIAWVVPQDIYHTINASKYALMKHLRMMDHTHAMPVMIAVLRVAEIPTQIAWVVPQDIYHRINAP